MREIELTQGRVAIVDDEDYNAVAQYQWQLLANRREGRKTDYAVGKENGTRKAVLMHRMVMGWPATGIEVDHINGDGLDNRKENLRLATRRQNSYNCRLNKRNKSGYRGVSWNKRRSAWEVRIQCPNDSYARLVGFYDDKVEAAMAWDEVAMATRGNFAKLNFPTVPAAPDADPSRPPALPSSRASEGPR